ncbi:RHS repeat-associated core domain-containing protein [Formosa sp. Hel1_33_131]|uniref:RHS repeat-associated core domain-containing protein n=1 Tax=Formosa sp. Hel1_33_131 TaxID=1336794 RepID=UPI0012FCD174|nr:RHS repeat-associated core domain-containing protein [Formosa sp. Hel1_33_131]
MDYLKYTYDDGNQLTGVKDHYNNTTANSMGGFKDGNTTPVDYAYDTNGNMTVDKNKNITSITYNYLNLPKQIQFDNTSPLTDGTISYVYDATGVKIEKSVSQVGSGTTFTQYAGNHIYKKTVPVVNNPNPPTYEFKLEFISQPEGYIEPNATGGFDYIYQYKDHLGNIRLSYKQEGLESVIDDFNDGTTGSWGAYASTISNVNNSLKVSVSGGGFGVYKTLSVTAGEPIHIRLNLDKGTTDKVVLNEFSQGNLSDLTEGSNNITYTPTTTGDFHLLIAKDPTSSDVGTQTYFNVDDIEITMGEDELVIVEENNYYPFGLKHKGYNNIVSANANSVARKFGFGGKELQDELGLDWYDVSARNYDPAIGRWFNPDPLAEEFSDWSPYTYAFNNPIYFIDPDGMAAVPPDDYVFNENGDYVRRDINNKPDKIVIENSKTQEIQGKYNFNDPNDVVDINSGKINKVRMVTQNEIGDEIVKNGSALTVARGESAFKYIERESRPPGDESIFSGISTGKLDGVSTSKLVQNGIGALTLIKGNGSSRDGTGYNYKDFGNFIWGRSGKALNLGITTLQFGAHLNNAFNGNSDNGGMKTGIRDSEADQRAIRAGYYYPNGVPIYKDPLTSSPRGE